MDSRFLSFSELTNHELYELLKLRVDVFVVEQECCYEEIDNKDQQAIHLLMKENELLVGYARILFEETHLHIGRIISHQNKRGTGIGKQLMEKSLWYCDKNYPGEPVYLSAQAHLEAYYQRFGFHTISKPYDWDGIDHIDMRLNKE